MLTNPSQLILRNDSLIKGQRVLLINHESDNLAFELCQNCTDVGALALDYHHHLALANHRHAKLSSHFSHQWPQSERFDTVILYFPKAKNLLPYLLQLAANHLQLGGQLLVTGENKGGIKSLTKMMPQWFSPAQKIDNARHSLLYVSELIETAPKVSLSDFASQYQLNTPQGELTICNLVGVFSESKLDLGTELLLQHLPQLQGRVLDFGCGAGVITAALLKAQPQLQLECIDINAMALAACELTLKANGLQANVYPSDGLHQTQGQFDAIISNPPFHDGLNSTTHIALAFVAASAKQLSPGGQWQIVANSHLPYADAIASAFKQEVNVIASTNKYKVYHQTT
ncbi:methyltransferase [Shewanella sp. NIFS-20-20]|uniref:methyltransferase n=1 Tax=Shewanella sp. NIFS-20-20 TaxID=2853806 RepID=UPI001C46CEC0|nr:methyltransferase [Shewanella sp. NIFS-20-20]